MSEFPLTPIEADASHTEAHAPQKSFFDPNAQMLGMTWLTFFILLVILYKFAFKPILAALDVREAAIRKTVEDSDKAREELAKINETRSQLIAEAEFKGRQMIEDSRKAAIEAAKTIAQKARDEAQIVLENAKREINEETKKAQAKIKQQGADIAVSLAGKLIQKNLDNETNKQLINRLIEDI